MAFESLVAVSETSCHSLACPVCVCGRLALASVRKNLDLAGEQPACCMGAYANHVAVIGNHRCGSKQLLVGAPKSPFRLAAKRNGDLGAPTSTISEIPE